MRPNEVYERTRVGLSGIVPGRAARSILDSGLGRARRSPEAISAEDMAKVLLGPVYHDLRGVVSKVGLRRQLKQLARALRALDPAAAATPQLVDEASASALRPTPAAPLDVDETPRGVPETLGGLPGPTSVAAGLRSLPADPNRVLAALAVLDGIDGVGVYEAAGAVVSVRGDLPEPEALGRVIAAAGSLLGRHGALRTVCVTTSHGVLVAVPVLPRWLAVTGARDLNLGAIYAALAALEEER